MIHLVAAYYSVPNDLHYCLFERVPGEKSARVLKDGKWIVLKKNNVNVIKSGNTLTMDRDLKLWLFHNDPAAQKLNWVRGRLPDDHKIITPLRPIQPYQD